MIAQPTIQRLFPLMPACDRAWQWGPPLVLQHLADGVGEVSCLLGPKEGLQALAQDLARALERAQAVHQRPVVAGYWAGGHRAVWLLWAVRQLEAGPSLLQEWMRAWMPQFQDSTYRMTAFNVAQWVPRLAVQSAVGLGVNATTPDDRAAWFDLAWSLVPATDLPEATRRVLRTQNALQAPWFDYQEARFLEASLSSFEALEASKRTRL